MAGFIRRYQFFPGTEVITAIEGVIIVDLPPPGAVQGVGTGVTALIGEFADMSLAVTVDTSGNVTTKTQPTEVTSSSELTSFFGGFDETIGEFGGDMGNGFIALRNKKYARLVIAAINLCSSKGVRLWRTLPTNKSATLATPTVPMQAASVTAGREFRTTGPTVDRVRVGQRVSFADTDSYTTATDGAVTAAGAAVTQTFNSAGALFLTVNNGGPVKKGDALVLGMIGGAGALGANADTYRVVADATTNTSLTVEKQDGSSFTWTTGTLLPYRLHVANTADSGGATQLSEVAGYITPARPLTNGSGSSATDGSIAASTLLNPALVPPTPDATSWDPLSGLKMRIMPGGALVYTAAVQQPNAPTAAGLDALYDGTTDSLLGEELPQREVNIVYSARTSTAIRNKLKSHVLVASSVGVGRRAILSPPLDTLTKATVVGDSSPGVGATRHERVDYCWPGAVTFVPEAVGFTIATADGKTTTDGVLDVQGDGWLAAVESNLPPERNPGQAGPPVPDIMAPILGLQRGVSGLNISDYTNFRSKGIVALRIDRTVGPIFQSGVTSSLISGEKNINRRRMADFIEDSCAQRLVQFAKLPLTNQLKDGAAGEVNAFMNELLSPNNPAAQRISAFEIDTKSGNTRTLTAKNIFVIIARVQTVPTADFIVLQAEIGEGVQITSRA